MSHRHTQFTLNEVDRFDSLKKKILEKNPGYVIACRETAPTTGHPHIHIYVQWGKKMRVITKKNDWEGAHIEKCMGKPEQNKKYIEKEGDIIFEQGEMKTDEKTRYKTIKEVKEMPKEERENLPIQYYNIVQRINYEEENKISVEGYHKEVTVIYYWGKSGVGKTKTAVEYIKYLGYKDFNEVKYENGFWNGTGNSDCALYDDFRDSHMKPSEFINFIDYNVHNMNIKNGVHKNKYRHIFITSIQDPYKIYANCPEEYREQWIRRIEIRHIE